MTLVRVENATVGYKKPIVGPLNFSVQQGDRLGIWGPNGCGKSTLLRYFSQSATLFDGQIEVPTNTSIAYQPQRPVRPEELPITGSEYLSLMDADKSDIPERITPFLHRRIDKLSGGQFQILSTWANLASNGKLVLLDEPTNNLDPEATELLIETIIAMPEEHGLLVVSHEKDFIEKVATNMLIIE